jgi:hypothetical protein
MGRSGCRPPAPPLRIRAEALLEIVERPAQRLESELVPGAADQLLVSLLPELEQVGVPAPRRGDVRDEAVVGSIEITLGEIPVADRRPGELPGQPEQERLVDRAGHGPRAESAVPALQSLERPHLALAGGL